MNRILNPIKKFFSFKSVKAVGVLILGFLGLLFVSAFIFNVTCGSAQPNFKPINDEIPSQFKNAEAGIENYHRAEESTYLTYPEWYLVFNPQEYGQFIANSKPSHFPSFVSIRQFWYGYCEVYGIGKRNYPFNAGDHFMEAVIGTSFSVEYAIKGVWENTIGRVSEWLSFGEQTQEDIYAAKVAQDYGNFIPTDPWYEFPFGEKFIGLWRNTSLFGSHFLRKFERKIFLSLEYGIKAGYAWLIRIGTHAVYGIADTEIYASVNAPDTIFNDSRVRKIKDLGNNDYIVTVPHYQGFTDTIPSLAQEGVQFFDFAGNNEILVTAIAPKDWQYDLKDGTLLFTMSMLANSSKRIAIQASVKSLSTILNEFKREGISLEHLYDY